MKREKRHGIERELSIKRIRSQKKYSILIVSVLLLTCILIQIGFQMSEGLKAAYIENRKAVYGEWEQVFVDMDESSVKVAEENPFLAQTGKISIYYTGAFHSGAGGIKKLFVYFMRDPKRLSDKLGNLQPASVSNWNCDTGRREQDRLCSGYAYACKSERRQ